MCKWRLRPVREIATVYDGPHATPKTVDDGPIFLGIGALNRGRIDLSETRHVTPEDFAIWTRRVRPIEGDIVFSYETRLGEAAIIPKNFDCCLGRRMGLVRVNRDVVDPHFFLYYFLAPAFQEIIRERTVHGATVNRILLTEFPSFPVAVPALDEQLALARLLRALDDKIELNRRMNETLEAMARAIFKDWFVDFGPTRAKMEGRAPYLAPEVWSLFPDRLDEEGKPEGWNSKPLDQVAHFLNGLALQKYPAKGGASLPVIKIAQLRAASVASADLASTEIPDDYVVENGDVLFSWSGSLLHRVWTAGRGALNQHLFKVTSEQFPKWLFFYWIAEHMPSFQATAASKATTMGHIQRHHLTQAITVVGDPPTMNAADELIGPLFKRQIANDLEARTLAALRDLLLPKLISGEIRIKDAEKLVEAAA